MVATQELKPTSHRAGVLQACAGEWVPAVAMYRSLGIAPARSANRHPRYSCTWEKLAKFCLSRAADVVDLRF